MRWAATPRHGWHTSFAILPVKIGERWVWLERYERRFMGDCYEVRSAAPLKEGE